MTRIGGPHVQITKRPFRQRFTHLKEADHILYKGSISKFFSFFTSILKIPSSEPRCWRVKEGKLLCTGERRDHINLLIAIPLLFTLEVDSHLDWDIPAVLVPDSADLVTQDGVIYDLVSLALISNDGTHFIARFYQDGRVYTYDGMKNQGYALREVQATFETHMTRKNIVLPQGFRVYELYYVLRGGTHAQDAFFAQRAVDLREQLDIQVEQGAPDAPPGLSYHGEGFAPMKPKLRYWHSQPENAHTLEYLTIDPDPKTLAPPTLDEGIPITPPASIVDLVSDSEKSVGHQEDSKPRKKTHFTSEPLPRGTPDSTWEINCRCGVSGNGNNGYNSDMWGPIIQCKNCRCWSHIACQRNERASHLAPNSTFICDDCDETEVRVRLGEKRAKSRKSERK